MPYKDPKVDRQYTRERYHWLKDHGICVVCAANYNEPGHVYCKACAAKQRRSHSTYNLTVDRAKRQREKRNERIRNGLCGDCGQPVFDDHVNCSKCREKRRVIEHIARIRKRIRREIGL